MRRGGAGESYTTEGMGQRSVTAPRATHRCIGLAYECRRWRRQWLCVELEGEREREGEGESRRSQ